MHKKLSSSIYLIVCFIFFLWVDLYFSAQLVRQLSHGMKISTPVFALTYVKNYGAAFSILQNSREILIILSVVAITLLFGYIIKHLKSMSDRYIEMLCKCNNIVANIVDNHYKYNDILNTFRHVVEEVGYLVNAQIAHAACHDALLIRFKDTVQDVMIQNAKIELLKSIILEIDKLTRTIEND